MEPDEGGINASMKLQILLETERMPLIYAYTRTPPPEEQIEAYFTGVITEMSEFVAYELLTAV